MYKQRKKADNINLNIMSLVEIDVMAELLYWTTLDYIGKVGTEGIWYFSCQHYIQQTFTTQYFNHVPPIMK